MNNKITFIPATREVELLVPPPKPAKLSIPEWFKNVPAVNEKNLTVDEGGIPDVNIKNCIPFFDIFTSGYIQETWTEIYINIEELDDKTYKVEFGFSSGPEIMSYREKPTTLKISDEYFPIEFIWIQHWVPIVPEGYSVLHTHPLNRFDLPFVSLSGVVDSDKWSHEYAGAYPFFLKKEYNGKIIPIGTPMFQMIPIKREPWESSLTVFNPEEVLQKTNFARRFIYDAYKNNFWTKKNYT